MHLPFAVRRVLRVKINGAVVVVDAKVGAVINAPASQVTMSKVPVQVFFGDPHVTKVAWIAWRNVANVDRAGEAANKGRDCK